jgi:hypothetical protein
MGDVGETFQVFNQIKKEERSKKEPSRFEFAIKSLQQLNVSYKKQVDSILIETKQGKVEFWPFTGWFCGRKPIGHLKGRGIGNLIASLKGNYNSNPLI